MPRLTLPSIFALLLVVAAQGCPTWSDQLTRAKAHYDSARYEAALTNFEDMERAVPELSRAERVKYAYWRGMTHLRLEQRSDARHWLVIAREENRLEPGSLDPPMVAMIERTLAETDPLNPTPRADASGDAGVTGQGADAAH